MEKWHFLIEVKKELINVIGHNFRLGEIESAIGIEQLKKLNSLIKRESFNKYIN